MKKLFPHAILFGMLALVLATAFYGIDFGHHWDESQFTDSLVHSLRAGIGLPLSYNYPSLSYDLFRIGILPERLTHAANIIEIAASHSFLLRMRGVFILISYTAVLWIYFWVWVWRKNWVEALLAATVYGLSWEIGYHARWAVSDTVLAQFVSLTFLCLFLAKEIPSAEAKRKWLRWSAVAAGLAFGTKYQALLLAAPVFLGVIFWLPKESFKRNAALCIQLIGLFSTVYFLTTPGMLLDQTTFWRDIIMQQKIYSIWGCGGHTVAPGIEHFSLTLEYLFAVLFSRYTAIAGFFFILAILGAVSLFKEDRKTAAVFFIFPLIFISVLCSQRVMGARNLLVLAPFLAVLASRGAFFLSHNYLKNSAVKKMFSAAIVLFLVINAFWLVSSARSIHAKEADKDVFVKQLAKYLDKYPETTFFATDRVIDELRSVTKTVRFDTLKNFSRETEAVVLYSSEVKPWKRWTANRSDYTLAVFGPYEVNFNYYPDWAGEERIVVLPVSRALELKNKGQNI